ncbi:mRNA cleavage and polyadenylation factor subunit [Savitreella phatthalungensis]
MSIYTTVVQPTAVSLATCASVTAAGATELLVVKRDLLQIFTLVEREEDLAQDDAEADAGAVAADFGMDDTLGELRITSTQRQTVNKLVLLSQHSFNGTITGLEAIRTRDFDSTGMHHVLLAFESAKLTLLKWDADAFDLITVSMHSFEREQLKSPLTFSAEPKLRLEPSGRVATLGFYGHQLAFMPVVQADLMLDEEESRAPISASFVLSALQLEEDVSTLLDFCYLEGYSEPTFAMLYNEEATSVGLKDWKQDNNRLVVMTLDLQDGARTAIFQVDNLPMTLYAIVPVPASIGGCLLLGHNEIIYVDPAARAIGIAVNRWSSKLSQRTLGDASRFEMQLEGACITPLIDGDELAGFLVNLASGAAALLTFKLDGRTVTSLELELLETNMPANVNKGVQVGARRLLLTSHLGDSHLVSWRRKRRRNATAEDVQEEREDDDDLDDIYGEDVEEANYDIVFTVNDILQNPGPISGMVVAREQRKPETWTKKQVQDTAATLVTVGGTGKSGNLTVHQYHVRPIVRGSFPAAGWHAMWSIRLRALEAKGDAESAMQEAYDTYLVAARESTTQILQLERNLSELTTTEFETSDRTIAAGVLADRTCLVQICPDMMRTYDADLKLMQLVATPEDRAVVSASVSDPFVSLLLDNGTVVVYEVDGASKDLVEVSHQVDKIVSAGVSNLLLALLPAREAKRGKKRARGAENGTPAALPEDRVLTSLDEAGQITLRSAATGRVVWSAHAADLPTRLRHGDQPEQPTTSTLAEVVLCELGTDLNRNTYLVLRTDKHEVVVYALYHDTKGLSCFRKVQLPSTRQAVATGFVTMPNVAGRSALFLCGDEPWLLLATDQGGLRAHPFAMRDILHLSPLHSFEAPHGFIACSGDGQASIAQLPDMSFDNLWMSKTVKVGATVHGVSYYAKHHLFALSTSLDERFEIPDEEDLAWQPNPDDRERLPFFGRGAVELFDAETLTPIDKYEFAAHEQPLALKTVNLSVSADYHKQSRELLACATAINRGEDLAIRGGLYVLDVVEVVPDPARPNVRHRLKFVASEELRSTCTVVAELDGYLLASTGQKVVIRALEEDERLTPVAFVDLGLFTLAAKCLRSMVLFADVMQGMTLVGFAEDPYKVTMFGRQMDPMECMDAEFMVNGRSLYLVASDRQGNIKVYTYDPEHPDSVAGQKLLRKADFHIGQVVSQMCLIPTRPVLAGTKHSAPSSVSSLEDNATAVVCGTLDGSIGLLTPLGERGYRRLHTIQAQLHAGAGDVEFSGNLNPRAHRACSVDSPTLNNAEVSADEVV